MIIQRKEAESEVKKPLLFLFSGISLQFLRMETKGKQKSLPSGPSSRFPTLLDSPVYMLCVTVL